MRIQLVTREPGPFMRWVWVGRGARGQMEGKEEGGAQQVTEDQPATLI